MIAENIIVKGRDVNEGHCVVEEVRDSRANRYARIHEEMISRIKPSMDELASLNR